MHDIQSLEWVLPETRSLLERQFRNEMMQSKAKQSNSLDLLCLKKCSVWKKLIIFNFAKNQMKILVNKQEANLIQKRLN